MKKSLKINELIKNILKVFLIIIFLILVIYNLMNINNKEDYVEIIGYKIFVVKEHQKQQGLEKNTIVVAKSKNNNFNINDLVAIRISNTIYFHRIVEIKGGNIYVTKGDGNYRPDEKTFKSDEIEGEIIKQIPNLGKVLIIAKTRFFSIIILIILIIVFRYNKHIYMKKIKRHLRKKSSINNNSL